MKGITKYNIDVNIIYEHVCLCTEIFLSELGV